MKLFNFDSPLMIALTKMADLMWLNILTLICCIPIVTAGASLTAMHYMALKIVRDEETYITQGFFKSFKENFKQATVIWLILLVASGILLLDYWLTAEVQGTLGTVVGLAVGAAAVLVILLFLYAFSVLAKFDNSTSQILKNSFVLSLMQFPKTIIMFLAYVVAFGILFFAFEWLPLFLFFGLSGPGWVSAKMCNSLFKKLEDQIHAANAPAEGEENPEEDERIFKDEIAETPSEETNGTN